MNDTAADLALYWLSHRGEVSHLAMRHLARKLYPEEASSRTYWQLTDGLQVLGHLEWNQLRQRWCTLAPYALKSSQGEALLCGARLPGWRPVLEQAVGLQLEAQYRDRGPQRWVTEEAPETCGKLAIPIFPERGLELLKALPELPMAVASLTQDTPPTSGQWERLSPRGSWEKVAGLVLTDGLYRRSDYPHQDYLLKVDGVCRKARSREDKALCWWYQQSRQRPMKIVYERRRAVLLLPYILGGRLPLVAERALCARSGLLPHPESRRYKAYSNLDVDHAEQLARILCCSLEVR